MIFCKINNLTGLNFGGGRQKEGSRYYCDGKLKKKNGKKCTKKWAGAHFFVHAGLSLLIRLFAAKGKGPCKVLFLLHIRSLIEGHS